jgi:DNA (cytosine-5)-methyltransferase 1
VGLDSEIKLNTKWPAAGVIHGPKRNVAWRILDAKFFGVPQQRKRLYVLAGGTSFYPENILFDDFPIGNQTFETPLSFDKEGHRFEIFRSYADCLYAAYGTKWNGNAAAYNGSLFVAQNSKLRRLTPLECERLMGFPDNFTDIPTAKPTQRFQAIGNSWAVPVVNWLGKRIIEYGNSDQTSVFKDQSSAFDDVIEMIDGCTYYRISTKLDGRQLSLASSVRLNGTTIPEKPNFGDLRDIVETGASERYYISPVGCKGILRRKEERQITINPRLEYYLNKTALEWSAEKIEEISRVQKRGKLSTQV